MKRSILLLLLLCACFSYAQTVKLTGTGKADLDGEYRFASAGGGRNRYVKKMESATYSIYCRREGRSSVWIIEDNRRNVYFGANADTVEPPAQGWDLGQAGAGLNANFRIETDLTTIFSPPAGAAETLRIRLQNNQDTALRIVVRAVSEGREVVRARTYRPFEIYDYQFTTGTKLYLLTEQEGELLMSSKGKEVPGRLLFTVRGEDADQTYPISTN
jgi:hypothetical protein